jgi:hypothetical protein
MKFRYLLMLLLFTGLFGGSFAQVTTPMERRLGFGAEFGAVALVPGGPYFGMAFSADYLMGSNFSIAEIISFTPSGDLTQINAVTVARFNIPTENVSIIPYLGIGFSYGSYDAELASENAFSLTFPIGAAVSLPVAAQIEAVGRFQFALTNLDYGQLGTNENYTEFMVGFRFSPL